MHKMDAFISKVRQPPSISGFQVRNPPLIKGSQRGGGPSNVSKGPITESAHVKPVPKFLYVLQ